jgi:hypothetical protein
MTSHLRYRKQGLGSRELPTIKGTDWQRLCSRMRDYGWTFEGGKKHGYTAYAPYWVPGGVSTVGIPGSPGRGRGFTNTRSEYRRWCREVGREPNV